MTINQIDPPHEVNDAAKVAAIAADLEVNGWTGRPLLVLQVGDYYKALTGTHRLAAAKAAGLEDVPVVEVDAEAFYADHDLSDIWDDEVTLGILEEIEDSAAADLMRVEVENFLAAA